MGEALFCYFDILPITPMNLITDDAALISIVPAFSTNSIVFTIPKSIPPFWFLRFYR